MITAWIRLLQLCLPKVQGLRAEVCGGGNYRTVGGNVEQLGILAKNGAHENIVKSYLELNFIRENYVVLFVSKCIFQQMCSKEHVFTKYQWSFYSSKQWSSGNIDEQSVFTKHCLFIGAQQQVFRKHWLDVQCLANTDYTIWSMFGKHSQCCDRCLV